MTIEVTAKELGTLIDALEDSRVENLWMADVSGRSRQKRYREAAEQCAVLSGRLMELAEEANAKK